MTEQKKKEKGKLRYIAENVARNVLGAANLYLSYDMYKNWDYYDDVLSREYIAIRRPGSLRPTFKMTPQEAFQVMNNRKDIPSEHIMKFVDDMNEMRDAARSKLFEGPPESKSYISDEYPAGEWDGVPITKQDNILNTQPPVTGLMAIENGDAAKYAPRLRVHPVLQDLVVKDPVITTMNDWLTNPHIQYNKWMDLDRPSPDMVISRSNA